MGSEGRTILKFDKLTEIPAENWGSLRLMIAPCVRLQCFDHPVHAFWSAFKSGQRPGPPASQTTCLAISRRDFFVQQRELTELEYGLLTRIARGETLASAIADMARLPKTDWELLERGVSGWFGQWTAAGFFLGHELAAAGK